MADDQKISEYSKGVIYTVGTFIIWGVLPIYWKLLAPINPLVIMLYRLTMSFLLVLCLSLWRYGLKEVLAPIRSLKTCGMYFVIGAMISMNWWLYIWMVNNEHIIQTSMGYYVNPLISCLIGFVVFKEKLSSYKIVAFCLMIVGVLIFMIKTGESPLLAFVLALTFAIYSAMKKSLKVKPLLSLLYETLFLMPIVLPTLIYMEISGKGSIGNALPYQYFLVIACGIVTAVPLILYGAGTMRLPMMTLGMIQYISPTMSLLIGVFLFKEPLQAVTGITFLFIWAGLIIFTYGAYREERQKVLQMTGV